MAAGAAAPTRAESPPRPIKRVHFFVGQPLGAADFEAEQDYHRRMRHLHNRVLHGWATPLAT